MLDAIRDWVALVGEPPRIYDWCRASARARGRDSGRAHLWQTSHPRWPSAGTVVGYHGSWRAALAPSMLIPAHCTGWKACSQMAARLPDAFVMSTVGSTITL